jgi:GT2 family glycosyltransferase
MSSPEAVPPCLSICIVTLQARVYLKACLGSIIEHSPDFPYEIIVVDNDSSDGTREMLQEDYPQVRVIVNGENRGYTAPMNQALRAARGDYLLQLNPDTVVYPGALQSLVDFLQHNPRVGICGPKVLNRDGSLQAPCRRGESRPWAVFSYFLGLSRLFPKSRLFGGYLLNYMDEDETHPAAGVSGSCMLIRREAADQIGYLDERFFAYQEDADYCFRAWKAGWQVYYVPQARIVHYGGQGGSRVQPYRSIIEWHRSYWLFYRKNFASDYFFLFNGFYYLVIGLKLLTSLGWNALRRDKYAGPKRA